MPTKTKKKKVRSGSVPAPDTQIDGTKFKSIYLVRIYRYAKVGLSEMSIAEAIPCDIKTWHNWKKKFPSIKQALEMGHIDTRDGGNWHKFVYDRLPEELRAIWDRISEWDELPNGMAKIEALLEDHGKSVRQQLFLYALIHSNFSASRAMAKVCIDKKTMQYWIEQDPEFAELVEEIQWHKGNFYEEHLVGLIQAGDTAATIFANRTFNKERGYAVKNELRVSGQIDHNLLDLSELELSPEVKVAILEAIQRREEKLKAQKEQQLIPIETRARDIIVDEIANVEESSCTS